MRRSLYASTAIHVGILLWVAFGGTLFRDSPETEFQATGVTILSEAEFEALTAGTEATPAVLEAPVAPPPVEESAAPEPPAPEEAPPPVQRPEETPEPQADTRPEPVPPTPQADVTDEIAGLSMPSGAPDLPSSDRPVPREAPRIAPVPAPAPEPDVETAPEVLDQQISPETSDTPTEEAPETAPEEATTEIVTEAETPSGGPVTSSIRPPARPSRPAPVETATAEPEPQPEPAPQPQPDPEPPTQQDPLADAIASAVADAVSNPPPSAPSGPPLTSGARDGFRIAVQACWNVGALSTEALQTTVVVAFDMARDGKPEAATMRLLEFSGGSETAAQQAYEAARRAIIRCGVNGYDLPEESYDHWRQVELVFNPEGMRLR